MPRAKDYTGQRFGKLTALEYAGSRRTTGGASLRTWKCVCDCGKEFVVDASALNSGNTQSCGCETKARTHGMHSTRLYQIWADMKVRCRNPENKFYERYGGRGISYQTSWESFEGFMEDMKEGYESNLTLDRINPNGDYCKENCRWATQTEQCRNKGMNRRNKTGVTGVHEWIDKYNGTVYYVASVKGLDGKLKSKHFSTTKYGKEAAFDLAIKYREQMIEELNLQGAGYTEYNGK